jgi:hypothetical protein
MRLNSLNSNPTPRRLRVINDDLVKHARRDAGRNEVIGAYRELSRLQKEVIDGQNARHLLAGQYQKHLRQQLASKSQTKTTQGGVLKSGYGALDEAALAKLEAEVEAKEAAEVAKVLAREEHDRMRAAEKLRKENEKTAKAAEKAEKAVGREAEKVARDAEKAMKAAGKKATKIAKAATKVAKDAELAARKAAALIGGGRARGRGRGGARGRGQRTGARPFPMSLPDIPAPRAISVNSSGSGNLTHSSIVLSDHMGIDSGSDGDDDTSDSMSDKSSIRSAITPPPDYRTVAPPANSVPSVIPECTLGYSRPVRTCRPTLRALGK